MSREEAKQILFAVDSAIEVVDRQSAAAVQLETAARTIVEKFLPDLRDL